MSKKLYVVELSADERKRLEELIRKSKSPAKKQLKAGKPIGRQFGARGKSVLPKLAEARAMLAEGVGIMKTAKAVGLGTGTVHRLKQEMDAG